MAAGKIVGLRAQNKMATRRELSRFGVELFLRQGFANTTIEQIVQPLGIARRTFFRYFNTKEELVFAWYEDLTPELVDALKSRPQEEKPFTAACEALTSLLRLYDANPDGVLAMMRLLKETPSLIGSEFEKRIVWERALVEALVERQGKKTMSPLKARIVAGTALTAFSAALSEWYEDGGNARLRPIVAKAFAMARDL
jgi:AcrR family transcriptional regulator